MRRLVSVLALLGIFFAFLACREQGPVEKAGREIDKAVEKLQHGDEGTLEKAGRKVDEALEGAKKEFEKSD